MSRHYFAVFDRLFRTPKFRKLPESARLTLFYAWSLAGDQDPEATWRDPQELAEYLDLYDRPGGDVASLLHLGFLDKLADGRVAVHDWDDYQLAADKATRNVYERDRKREWRRSREKRDGSEEIDKKGPGHRPGHVPATPADMETYDPETWPAYWSPFFEAWRERGWKKVTKAQREMLWEICRDWPTEAGDWVRASPEGLKPHEVIGSLLEQLRTARSRRAA